MLHNCCGQPKMNMTPSKFVRELQHLYFPNSFNPYSDLCAVHDHDDAPDRRSALLYKILDAAVESEVDSLWVGRDLGYRGGRRTGLAFTDDERLPVHAERWNIAAERSTVGEAVSERTATIIWNILDQISTRIFLWNVFPLHPHIVGRPFTNRPHNSHERTTGRQLLVQLIDLLKPRRLVPIGKDATSVAGDICGNLELCPVRHPSYGGEKEFSTQMRKLYGLN